MVALRSIRTGRGILGVRNDKKGIKWIHKQGVGGTRVGTR